MLKQDGGRSTTTQRGKPPTFKPLYIFREEEEYEKFGVTALRPRATLFCGIGGVGITIFSASRWLSGGGMDASKETMMLVRFLVSILSLLLLPCTYLYPKHWKKCISTFIVMNTLTFVVYNYRKVSSR